MSRNLIGFTFLICRRTTFQIERAACLKMMSTSSTTSHSPNPDQPHLAQHKKDVDKISEKVKAFYASKTHFRIYHGATNSTRNFKIDPTKIVDTSSLNRVIHIDQARQTAIVEPNVPMDALVDATLKYGMVPPVVPEFPGITVGGSFSGTAGESSSFKYGFFDRIVNWCEIVLANGRVVRASASENPDLFYGSVAAFGTLGVTTLFEIQLRPAQQYVEVNYIPVRSAADAIAVIKQSMAEDHDFIDGILYSRWRGVVVTGKLVSQRTAPASIPSPGKQQNQRPRRFTRPHDEWYYLHCAQAAAQPQPTTDLIPLRDYLFRYDRGAFWMGSYAFHFPWLPFNRATRWLLNPLMRTRQLYAALHHSGQAQRFIIQDLVMPEETAVPFIDYVHYEHNIYPLWLCPFRADGKATMQRGMVGEGKARPTDLFINVGVWGSGKGYDDKPFSAFKADNRALEKKVRELGGTKWLYAHVYYTQEEFWDIYDREAYHALRKKYDAENLPNVWDKVRSEEEPVSLKEFKGGFLALLGRGYLLKS